MEDRIIWTARGTCDSCGKAIARRSDGPGYLNVKCNSCGATHEIPAARYILGPDGPTPAPVKPSLSLPAVSRYRLRTRHRRVWATVTGALAVVLIALTIFALLAPPGAFDDSVASASTDTGDLLVLVEGTAPEKGRAFNVILVQAGKQVGAAVVEVPGAFTHFPIPGLMVPISTGAVEVQVTELNGTPIVSRTITPCGTLETEVRLRIHADGKLDVGDVSCA